MLASAYWQPKYEVTPSVHNSKAACITKFGHDYVFLPANRPEDGYYIIWKHRIALIPHGKTRWMAYHENGMNFTDRKPLRAAMIVYLMMQEGK